MTRKDEIKWDIIVLGAGAAGCMAAITAARRGAHVLLLEQNDRIGKKILATGNGKCNYTNADMTIDAFRGNRGMVQNALNQFGLEETLALFREIGIYPKCKNGYYYPNSQTASSVRNALEAELAQCGVELRTEVNVTNISYEPQVHDEMSESEKNACLHAFGERPMAIMNSAQNIKEKEAGRNFRLTTTVEPFWCEKLILATGLLASPKSGSNGSAFGVIKALGHHFTDIVPALCGFYAKGLDFRKVAGVRTDARVTLYIEGKEAFLDSDGNIISSHGLACCESTSQRDSTGYNNKGKCPQAVMDSGELQLTDYGISGIPVFQISRYASFALNSGLEAEVSIDFLPSLTSDEVREELMRRFHGLNKINRKCKGITNAGNKAVALASSSAAAMNGLLNEKLNLALLKAAGLSPTAASTEIPAHKIDRLCTLCKDCRVILTAPRDFTYAQVCAGGIKSEEVDERTLESKLVPGLYFAGEMLDVDGICGGYNLQWAWSSGYVTGSETAKLVNKN